MTTYIGVDLAWSAKNRTGLAALDSTGQLLDMADVVSDDEIVDWLQPHVDDRLLAAIDAPIIVTNQVGQRPCERDLSSVFHAFHAGTHPTNLSKPEFAAGSRALGLCRRAGLDVDPTSNAPTRAIEVYPHPATITLFDLDVIIPYKHKSGREFADLQASLLELVSHLEGLRDAEPPLTLENSMVWLDTVASVQNATQKSHLRRAEDRIDAVLCAYVGLLFDEGPETTRVIGDVDTGYIVVPVDERVRGKVDALPTVTASRQAERYEAARAPILVQLDELTALVMGEGQVDDLELVEPPLLDENEKRNIAGAVSIALGGANVAAQAATALPAVRGLVRRSPDTVRQLATNAPLESGGWNLGTLQSSNGQISHQVRWLPAGSAGCVSVLAQLGPAAALLGMQLQLSEVAHSVEKGITLTREVQRTLNREHRSEVSASYETVRKALQEAIYVKAVPSHVWGNVSGEESALRKQRTRELDAVQSLTRDLGGETSAKGRRAWLSEHGLDLIDRLNSLREAHQAWFTYQALRAAHIHQAGRDADLVEHIVSTARREHDEAVAQLEAVADKLIRLAGLLRDMPAARFGKLTGTASTKSIEQTLDLLRRLEAVIEVLPTDSAELPSLPSPAIRVAHDDGDTEVALRMSRWHLAPSERMLAIAQGSQTAMTSWLFVTDCRVLLMKQSDLFDGDNADWVSRDDIRYVRQRRSKLNMLYPIELTITTKDRDLTCSFGRWASEFESAAEMDRLTTLLRSMMTLPLEEVPTSPLLKRPHDEHAQLPSGPTEP